MYKNTLLKELKFKSKIKVSEEVKNLIYKLLMKNPNKRMGSIADSLELISHPWFSDFNWTGLLD